MKLIGTRSLKSIRISSSRSTITQNSVEFIKAWRKKHNFEEIKKKKITDWLLLWKIFSVAFASYAAHYYLLSYLSIYHLQFHMLVYVLNSSTNEKKWKLKKIYKIVIFSQHTLIKVKSICFFFKYFFCCHFSRSLLNSSRCAYEYTHL